MSWVAENSNVSSVSKLNFLVQILGKVLFF